MTPSNPLALHPQPKTSPGISVAGNVPRSHSRTHRWQGNGVHCPTPHTLAPPVRLSLNTSGIVTWAFARAVSSLGMPFLSFPSGRVIFQSHLQKLFDLQAGLRSPLGSQFSGTQPDVVYFSGLGGDRASSCSPLCTRVPEFDENSHGGEASSSCRFIFVSATALQIGHGLALQNGASSPAPP